MKDPDANDTEPTGCAFASAEDTDPQGHAAAATSDAPFVESPEHDTDDFLRWLPTMSLGHRRRTELVERPSSDGADFAAYACAGRPAAASVRLPSEAAVQMRPFARATDGDAPTVLSRRKLAGRRRRVFAWASGGLVVACAVVGGWAHRPEPPPRPDRAATIRAALAGPPPRATPPESMALPLPVASQASPQAPTMNLPMPPMVQRAAPSAPPIKAHKREAASAHVGIDMAATSHPPLVVAASAAAAKDQYFETP
jgi:hypothetical protein